MAKLFTDAREFTSSMAWGARALCEVQGASVRLHWTDEPYKWHVNDAPEVFVVLDRQIEMSYRSGGSERKVLLETGHIFVTEVGDEHMACPIDAARVLVVEHSRSH